MSETLTIAVVFFVVLVVTAIILLHRAADKEDE